MNIGLLSKQGDGTTLFGNLPSLHLRDVSFERVTKTGDQPDYRISVAGAELGAGWIETSKDGKTKYVSATIDSPLFSAKVKLAVFDKGDGNYAVVWDRPKAKTSTDTEEGASF
jgi:uncharacterized protein (DUF736 family)